MKKKYILEVYDDIISKIKRQKTPYNNEITASIKQWTSESFLIYQINFIKNRGKIKYIAKNPIHNLHPKASKIITENKDAIPEFESFIPAITKELSLCNTDKNYHWSSNAKNNCLYILVKCKIEDLPQQEQFFLYCYHSLKNENDRIKKINKERVFKFKSKERIEQYIHKKQYALEILAHRVIKEINPVNSKEIYQFSNNYDKIDCLKIAYIYLEKLLRFIERDYKDYLNVNIQIPYRSILIKEYEIIDKLNKVKSILLSSNINNQLLKLVYEPILKLSTIKIQEKITYYEFNYCSDFISFLYNHLNNENSSETTVKECLIDINFNSLEFFKLVTDDILTELNLQENIIQKIEVLYRLLKNYNQKQTRNFIKYKSNLPSINQQVIAWIEEEIDYLQKKIKLENNTVVIPRHDERKKMLSGISVAQLSYLFNLLVQSNIIKPNNQREIFKFIAENFKTSITDTISSDSVSAKFYNVETGTKNAIRQKIIEMLNQTKH
jgi:hypothetical protein